MAQNEESGQGADRRRSPRVEALGRVRGQLVRLEVSISVLDVSLGGMRIEAPISFESGSINSFLLTLGDGSEVEVYGKIVYTRRLGSSDPPVYQSGVQFVDQDDENPQSSVGEIISKLK